MAHPYLPELDPNYMEAFDTPGVWVERGRTEIASLIRSINTFGSSDEVHGIPDPWGYPLSFGFTLSQPSSAGYTRTRGEWRGLIALLGLRVWRNIPQVSAVKFDVRSSQVEFSQALSLLLPDHSISESASWGEIWILLFGERPVGITSPKSLVCPAADYANHKGMSSVPWYDGKTLTDPLAKGLPKFEREALAWWIASIHATLSEGKTVGGADWAVLSRELKSFQVDLVGESATIPAVGYSKETALGIDHPVFGVLNEAPLAASPVDSHLFLRTGERNLESQRSYILFEPSLHKQWNQSATDIVVWNTSTLVNAEISPDRRRVNALQLPSNVYCLTTDDFFTNKLLLIGFADSLPGSLPSPASHRLRWNSRDFTPLVPLKLGVLELYSARELADKISIEPLKSGEIVVRLRLQVGNPLRECTISKTYSENSIELLAGQPSVLELWPNVGRSDWKRYYCYFCEHNESFYALPIVDGMPGEPRSIPGEPFRREITRMESWPEAILCSLPDGAELGGGLILLADPTNCNSFGTRWTVGVDFGTTGTRVYYSSPNGRPVPMRFDSQLLKVTESEGVMRTAFVSDDFVPTDKVPKDGCSILSVWADLPNPPAGNLEPLTDGHIHFVRLNEDYEPGTEGNWTDLKWSSNPEERTRSRAFIEQLCLHICAQAASNGVSSISWRFSVPSSFSEDDISNFSGIWSRIAADCSAWTGVKSSEAEPKFVIESIAAARYFAGLPDFNSYYGAVCIDIGGGTSDIAFWQGENELKLFSSVRLAGRDIFVNPMLSYPELLTDLDKNIDIESLKRAISSENPKAFYAAVDALLQDKGDALLEKFGMASLEHLGEAWRDFLSIVRIGIAGLVYYAGLLLRFGYERNVIIQRVPKFHIGGNGARMLDWACNGRFRMDDPFIAKLGEIFFEASGFVMSEEEEFLIVVSDSKKGEVAYGLVAEHVPFKVSRTARTTLAGEIFTWAKGTELGNSLTPLTPNHIIETSELATSLDSLKVVLRHMGAGFTTRELAAVAQDVNAQIVSQSMSKSHAIRLDSFFIMALKQYLNRRAQNLASSAKKSRLRHATASGTRN